MSNNNSPYIGDTTNPRLERLASALCNEIFLCCHDTHHNNFGEYLTNVFLITIQTQNMINDILLRRITSAVKELEKK